MSGMFVWHERVVDFVRMFVSSVQRAADVSMGCTELCGVPGENRH